VLVGLAPIPRVGVEIELARVAAYHEAGHLDDLAEPAST
jgi:hypothetical protein